MVVLENCAMIVIPIFFEEGYGGVPHPPVLGRPTRPGTPLPAPPEWGAWKPPSLYTCTEGGDMLLTSTSQRDKEGRHAERKIKIKIFLPSLLLFKRLLMQACLSSLQSL